MIGGTTKPAAAASGRYAAVVASDFRTRVLDATRQIPSGRVATYGDVALQAGAPRAARQVGGILRRSGDAADVPWQRVVNARGGLSTTKIGFGELQAALLRAEGVVVDAEGVDLARYRHRFPPPGPTPRWYDAGMRSTSDDAVVALTQALVRAVSPSGRERPAALALTAAMTELGFDEVSIDAAGNAIGVITRGAGPTLVFNGHLDTVPVGDEAAWPVAPLSGEIVDGYLWGRGSVDMKGAVAAMTVAAAAAAADGFEGTLIVSGVVQEEVGGLGARAFAAGRSADLVVLGEPSSLALHLGHRGRIEAQVTFTGRIAHAAKAELGDNALLQAARYALALEGVALPRDETLRGSTATVTQLDVHPKGGANVVPGRAVLTVDYRNVPADPPEAVLERLAAIDPRASVAMTHEHAVAEGGAVAMTFPRANPAYLVPDAHPSIGWAQRVLSESLGAPVPVATWWFATDAPHLAAMGAPVLGFGPGNPEVAHTTREAIALPELHAAVAAYRALARAFLIGRLPWDGDAGGAS
jgi:succinyl-diaminopimelate desuccinylase